MCATKWICYNEEKFLLKIWGQSSIFLLDKLKIINTKQERRNHKENKTIKLKLKITQKSTKQETCFLKTSIKVTNV